jgi:DNA-binding LytR/AlgR family response regulator
VTQDDIIKRYYSGWRDHDPEQHEHKAYATLEVSERLAQTALASILPTSSDAGGCGSANAALDAPDKVGMSSDDIPDLDTCTPEGSGLELQERLEESGHQLSVVASAPAHDEHATAIAQPQLRRFSPRQSAKIAIKANGKIVFIDPDDVIAVEAEGNYVSLQRRSDSYLLRESISVMVEILKPYGFIRIHRSVLVNSSFVEQIQSRPAGAYGLRTKGGKEYTVTRTYKNNLKSLAAAWIGTDIFLDE